MDNNKTYILNIVKLFLLFLGVPLIGYIFYTGNYGNFYGYYLTGYYLIIVLLFSFLTSFLLKYRFGKLIIIVGLALFLGSNLKLTIKKLNIDILNSNEIVLQNQIMAINWIKEDSGNHKFNVDVYVPPVIPHSYNYLFKWLDLGQSEDSQKLLYTLYEIDPPHPERLDAWLARQDGIGKVEETVKFGGITVERRERKNLF